MRKTVKGSDGFGNQRTYDFEILNALEGLTIMHTYGSLLTQAIPQVTALVEAWQDSGGQVAKMVKDDLVIGEGPIIELLKVVPMIISTSRLLELAKVFLANAVIEDQECDADGMCDLFTGRPHEVYAAIVHAVIANFPDYLPFLDNPGDTTGTKLAE